MLKHEEEEFYESVIVPIAHKVLNDSNSSNRAKYYAALIVELTGDFEGAINHLRELAQNGFIPANYQIAQLYCQRKVEDTNSLVINNLSAFHFKTNSYFANPKKILISVCSENLLDDIFELVYFVENDIILKIIDAYPGTTGIPNKKWTNN
jgi:hypothetical protein